MAPTVRARGWSALILVLYAALVVVAFVIPRPIDRGFTPWLRGVVAQVQRHVAPSWFDYEFVELAAHVVLFVPIGILMVVAFGRRLTWLAVLAGLGMSALVEFGSSRAAGEPLSWLDLLLNAVGAVVGAAIGYAVLTGLRSEPGTGAAPMATRS